jgi:hypothetical protein
VIRDKQWMRWALAGFAPAFLGLAGMMSCAGPVPIVTGLGGGTGGETCPFTQCDTACIDTKADPANCGSCGHACNAGEVCAAGTCALSCPTPLSICGTLCVDTSTSAAHCGDCNTACPTGQSCSGGQCSLVCQVGSILCAGPGAGDGGTAQICVDPTHDGQNCGGCGVVCPAGEYCSSSTCSYPTSCADVLAKAGPVPDGSYVVQPAGRKEFTVYCAGMSTASPKEYLTLQITYDNGISGSNVSRYDKASCKCNDDAHRYFDKVRLDPATLVVDRTDATFAKNVTADPACWAAAMGVCSGGNKLLYAQAGNCILNGAPQPGNIDFHGTPFSIDPSVTFVPVGYIPYGTSTFSTDRKKVDFAGGGDCGETDPSGPLLLKQD